MNQKQSSATERLFFSLILFLMISFVFSFGFAKKVNAQVVINEFSPASNPNGYGDWIELYVYEDTNLSDYYLTHIKTDGTEGNITIPEPYNYGPNSENGKYKVISVGNFLGNTGDRIRLYRRGNPNPIDDISYGDQGGVCVPSQTGSVARIPDGGNTIDRLAVHTQGATNGELVTDPCPTPTPIPTSTPTSTPTPKPTNSPTATTTSKPTSTPTVKNTSATTTPISKNLSNTPTDLPKEELVSSGKTEDQRNFNEVLGIQEASSFSPTPTVFLQERKRNNNKIPLFSGVLIVLGISFMVLSLYPIFKKKGLGYNLKSEKEVGKDD